MGKIPIAFPGVLLSQRVRSRLCPLWEKWFRDLRNGGAQRCRFLVARGNNCAIATHPLPLPGDLVFFRQEP
ncbi:MAG: hypothetical protein F6J93_35535 [Oscillatoria sp. SIO1A7]|nr:hypothetical protein [Oscillatoria sp. SIO1A7]